jgi:hypothetical protein
LNARLRFVVLAAGLFLTRPSLAQDSPIAPAPAPTDPAPSPPPPAEPTPPSDSVPSPPPSSAAPDEPPPPAAEPAPPGEAAPPVLAPLPPEPGTSTAAFPSETTPPPTPPKASAPPADDSPSAARKGAAAAASPSGAESKPNDKKPESESHDGLFGPFRIGLLVGSGMPSILSISGEIRLTRYFGAGVRIGLIPTVRFAYYGQATVSYQDYGAYAHLHPFGGGFLLGAELGYALVKANYTGTYDTSKYAALGAPPSISSTTDGSVDTLVITPELGYIYTSRAGFTFGFDLGAQIPAASSHVKLEEHVVAPGIPASLLNPYLAADQEKVRQTLVKVGQTVLPAFHIRIGWLL